jgi:histidine triad (HIT) family protein
MDCIFCKIANKEVPQQFVFEDGQILGFADIKPKAPTHYLFIPREHIESIMHLGENHSEIIAKLIYAAKQVAEGLGLKGYKLVFNVGREGGQVIDHLHLHLMGGWFDEKEVERVNEDLSKSK